jgi:hypothetical protein
MDVADSSRASLAQISMPGRKSLLDLIESVVAQACRSGAKDLSMKEVQAALRRVHGRDVEVASISARVNELVSAGRLVRDKLHMRPCTVTGRNIEPLSAPMVQDRMFY